MPAHHRKTRAWLRIALQKTPSYFPSQEKGNNAHGYFLLTTGYVQDGGGGGAEDHRLS